MSAKNKRIRLISFLSSCFGVISVAIFPQAKAVLLSSINNVLNFEPLYLIIIGISILLGIYYTYYIRRHQTNLSGPHLLKIFGPLIDPTANTLAFGAVIVTSLRMIRGLFCQYFFNVEYFKDFGLFDVTSVALCSAILLIWGTSSLVKYSLFFFSDTDSIAKTEAVPNIDDSAKQKTIES